jgi:septal ring factor EnvC (AmiA/AmiB activator)
MTFLQNLVAKLGVKLIAGILIAAAVVIAFFYIKDLKSQIVIANQHVVELTVANKTQQDTIATLNQTIEERTKNLNDVISQSVTIETDNDALKRKLDDLIAAGAKPSTNPADHGAAEKAFNDSFNSLWKLN